MSNLTNCTICVIYVIRTKCTKIFLLSFLICSSILNIQQANAAIIIGNPQGNIILSFVYGYQCVHCHDVFPIIKKLITEDPDLCVELYPVAALNKNSLFEATAAIAATKIPGKFQELNSLLMHQPPLQKPDIDAILHRIGLDNKDFLRSMHKRWVSLQILEGLKILQQVHSQMVPVILIGKKNASLIEQTILIGKQNYKTLFKSVKKYQSNNRVII